VVHPEMRLGEVAKLILLSFDATLRSNLSVGMPIDLLLYERDTLDVRRVRRIDENDDYYRMLSNRWAEALRAAVASMDEYKD
jgi:putative proteasome-type protease